MGGDTAGPIPMHQRPDADNNFSLWEKRVDALMTLGSAKGFFTVDGLRRVLEDMGEDAFETMTYYKRWIMAVNQNLIEGGAYTTADLAAKNGRCHRARRHVRRRYSASFMKGV